MFYPQNVNLYSAAKLTKKSEESKLFGNKIANCIDIL